MTIIGNAALVYPGLWNALGSYEWRCRYRYCAWPFAPVSRVPEDGPGDCHRASGQEDARTLLEAVKLCGAALCYVPDRLKTPKICAQAVKSSAAGATPVLEWVPYDLRNEELCLAAVRAQEESLRWVPRDLCTYEICLVAVRQKPGAIARVPEDLKSREMCREAVQSDPRALQWVPYAWRPSRRIGLS